MVEGLREDLEAAGAVWVVGEVSGITRSRPGHLYFTLKDDRAQLSAVMFSGAAWRLTFEAEDGLEVRVQGRLSVYPQRGQLQLIVEQMVPEGRGAQQLALEQLRAKLEGEGLFERSRKRPIPPIPRRVGIVTSLAGAALRDMLTVLRRRFPRVPVVISDCRVQGEGAAADITRALRRLVRARSDGLYPDLDVVLIGRGGGSFEDLAAFHDESLVRAVAACPIPTIAAVGHETDVSLIELAADQRALTPTEAAERAVPDRVALAQQVGQLGARLARAIQQRHATERRTLAAHTRRLRQLDPRRVLGDLAQQLDGRAVRLDRAIHAQLAARRGALDAGRQRLHRAHPSRALAQIATRLGGASVQLDRAIEGHLRARTRTLEGLADRLHERLVADPVHHARDTLVRVDRDLERQLRDRLARDRRHVRQLAARLDGLSPLRVLGRGYAVVFSARDQVVSDARTVTPGDMLHVRLDRGSFRATVAQTRPSDPRDGLAPPPPEEPSTPTGRSARR